MIAVSIQLIMIELFFNQINDNQIEIQHVLEIIVEIRVVGTMLKYVLGLDIGTSSVKGSVVEIDCQSDSFIVKCHHKTFYDHGLVKKENLLQNFSQQSCKVIVESIDSVLKQIHSQFRHAIDLMAICGQMHGFVLWNQLLIDRIHNEQKSICSDHSQSITDLLDYELISDNYDWTDQRCDPEFLSTLPTPNSHGKKICSGFACATLFWLKKHQAQYLEQFDRCGTIMDWLVCVICCLDQVPISLHNAHSWGYFDATRKCWNMDILKSANFPVHLLPNVQTDYGKIVGRSQFRWHCIGPFVPVLAALGDFQSIIHLAMKDNMHSLVLNMGTSSQLCCLVDQSFIETNANVDWQQIDFYPFQDDQYLLVAASLNGGNVLKEFVKFLQSIIQCLTGTEIEPTDIWNKIFQLFPHTDDGGLKPDPWSIKPTLFGERHDPNGYCSIKVGHRAPTLLQLSYELCMGLVQNLFRMFPNLKEMIQDHHRQGMATRLVCTGSGPVTNPILRMAIKNLVGQLAEQLSSTVNIEYIDQCDADVGCAIFSANQFFNQYKGAFCK